MLYPHRDKIAAICAELPSTGNGVVVAKALPDALPAHLLSMTPDGVREVYGTAEDHGDLKSDCRMLDWSMQCVVRSYRRAGVVS